MSEQIPPPGTGTDANETPVLHGLIISRLRTMLHDLKGYRDGVQAKFGKEEANSEFEEWSNELEATREELSAVLPEEESMVETRLTGLETAMHDYFCRRLGLLSSSQLTSPEPLR